MDVEPEMENSALELIEEGHDEESELDWLIELVIGHS